jgi:hypothetical protein
MGLFSSWLHPEKGYKAGQGQLDKYYSQGMNFVTPYANQGKDVYLPMVTAMADLLNPQALQDRWRAGYTESAAAKNAEARAQEHGLSAASSMGLLGSSPALQAIQAGTAEIGAADEQKYMEDLMDKYKTALGIGTSIYGTGATAAGLGANAAGNMGENSANMAYGAQNSPGSLMNGLLGMGGSILGSALGGPLGGMLGSKLGWSTTGGK